MRNRRIDNYVVAGRRISKAPAFQIVVGPPPPDQAAFDIVQQVWFDRFQNAVNDYLDNKIDEQKVSDILMRLDLPSNRHFDKVGEIAQTTGFLDKVKDRYLAYHISDFIDDQDQFDLRVATNIAFKHARYAESLLDNLQSRGANRQIAMLEGVAEMAVHNASSVLYNGMNHGNIFFGQFFKGMLISGRQTFISAHGAAIDYLVKLKLQSEQVKLTGESDAEYRKRARNIIRRLSSSAGWVVNQQYMETPDYTFCCRGHFAERLQQVRRENLSASRNNNPAEPTGPSS